MSLRRIEPMVPKPHLCYSFRSGQRAWPSGTLPWMDAQQDRDRGWYYQELYFRLREDPNKAQEKLGDGSIEKDPGAKSASRPASKTSRAIPRAIQCGFRAIIATPPDNLC